MIELTSIGAQMQQVYVTFADLGFGQGDNAHNDHDGEPGAGLADYKPSS